jgi:hypothetical protein
MTRILYQFATAKQHTDLGQAEVERRLAYLRTKVSAGTEVEVATPAVGPGSIESDYEAALAVPEILRSIDQAEARGFDAAIISCFSDPGLEPAREIARIPILGSGLCAMHAAAADGTLDLGRANQVQMRLARILVPINYTREPRFRHDPAYSCPPLPTLQAATELAEHGDDTLGFAKTQLMRGQNRYLAAVEAARSMVEEALP